jgi:phage shock protein B
MSVFLFVPALLFVILVLPLWLLLHYVTRWRAGRGLSAEDERMLADLWQQARKLEDRVGTLETILDAEAPGWRTRS